MLRRALSALFIFLAVLGLGATALWLAYGWYVEQVVVKAPSTQPLVKAADAEFRLGVYVGGDQAIVSGPGAAMSPQEAVPDLPKREDAAPAVAEGARSRIPNRPLLPPTRLRVPRIQVNALVVLADNDNLPQFKGIGWYMGSGYPGFRGNAVFFGHLDGPNETLARMHELAPGDEVVVEAMDNAYRYVVSSSRVVPDNAVEVMAPSDDYRLTLITCAGTFDRATRNYSHRLVVVAHLAQE